MSTAPFHADEPTLDALAHDPPRAGALANAARAAKTGATVWIADRPTEPDVTQAAAVLLRPDGTSATLSAWPDPTDAALGDARRLTLRVEPSEASRFADYLRALAEAPRRPAAIAPFCPEPHGTHRLWCIAAARIALPDDVRVEARHDLIGSRMAQLALAFGADALGGPIERDRVLPLAGVTRPTDTTRAGLRALVEQAGLAPIDEPIPSHATAGEAR